MEIAKRVAGTLTVLATVATLLTISSDTNIAFSCADDQLRAKAWQTTGDPDWMLSATDTDLTTGTYAGAMARRETGSGALTTFGFDDFQIYNQRFFGSVASVEPDFIPTTDGDPLSVARVTAAGVLRRLSQNDKPLKSALTRAMIGDTEGDFRAIAHWSTEDGESSTQFASSLVGQAAATFSGDVLPAAYDGFPGSLPLPVLNTGGTITATMPTFSDTGVWQIQHTFYLPVTTSGDADLMSVKMVPGSTVAEYRLTYIHDDGGLGQTLRLTAYSAAGAAMAQVDRHETFTDHRLFVSWTDYTDSGSHVFRTSLWDGTGANYASLTLVPDGVGVGAPGRVRSVTASASANVTGWSYGQLGLYVDPAMLFAPHIAQNAQAANGYDGELPTDRLARLCREQGESIDIADGGSTQPMGPQTTNTFLGLLGECSAVDGGALGEQADGFGLAYVPVAARLNRHVGATIDLAAYNTTSGTSSSVLAPTFDDQGIANDVTVSRINGSSATATDTAHIALYGRYEGAPPDPLNVQSDGQLTGKASWLLVLGTTTPVRYPDTPIELHANVDTLLSPWLGLRTGLSRVARTNLPTKAGTAGDDRMLDTYTEVLEPRRWTGSYDGASAEPYKVGTWGGSRWGMLWQTLATDANIADTSWSVATATGKTLPVTGSSAPNFPLTIIAGGLEYEVTAISGSTSPQTFTVTPRADGKLQPAGTQITLKDPLRWAPV